MKTNNMIRRVIAILIAVVFYTQQLTPLYAATIADDKTVSKIIPGGSTPDNLQANNQKTQSQVDMLNNLENAGTFTVTPKVEDAVLEAGNWHVRSDFVTLADGVHAQTDMVYSDSALTILVEMDKMTFSPDGKLHTKEIFDNADGTKNDNYKKYTYDTNGVTLLEEVSYSTADSKWHHYTYDRGLYPQDLSALHPVCDTFGSNWTINGINASNSDNYQLYAQVMTGGGGWTVIYIFKDAARQFLVAQGTVISYSRNQVLYTLTEQNGSGISGTVWHAPKSLRMNNFAVPLYFKDLVKTDEVLSARDGSVVSTNYYSYTASTFQLHTVEYRDTAKNTTRIEYFDASGALIQTTSYTYNADGTRTVDYKDAAGKTTRIEYFDASGAITQTAAYTYNADGTKTVEYNDADSLTIRIEYFDATGKTTKIRYFNADGPAYAQTAFYTYNADGTRMVEYKDASSKTTKLEYFDAVDKITKIEYFDAAGKTTKVEYFDASGAITQTAFYTYNADGTKTIEYKDAAGTIMKIEYFNVADKITHIEWFDASGALTQTAFYTYNADGTMTVEYKDAAGTTTKIEYFNASGVLVKTIYYAAASYLGAGGAMLATSTVTTSIYSASGILTSSSALITMTSAATGYISKWVVRYYLSSTGSIIGTYVTTPGGALVSSGTGFISPSSLLTTFFTTRIVPPELTAAVQTVTDRMTREVGGWGAAVNWGWIGTDNRNVWVDTNYTDANGITFNARYIMNVYPSYTFTGSPPIMVTTTTYHEYGTVLARASVTYPTGPATTPPAPSSTTTTYYYTSFSSWPNTYSNRVGEEMTWKKDGDLITMRMVDTCSTCRNKNIRKTVYQISTKDRVEEIDTITWDASGVTKSSEYTYNSYDASNLNSINYRQVKKRINGDMKVVSQIKKVKYTGSSALITVFDMTITYEETAGSLNIGKIKTYKCAEVECDSPGNKLNGYEWEYVYNTGTTGSYVKISDTYTKYNGDATGNYKPVMYQKMTWDNDAANERTFYRVEKYEYFNIATPPLTIATWNIKKHSIREDTYELCGGAWRIKTSNVSLEIRPDLPSPSSPLSPTADQIIFASYDRTATYDALTGNLIKWVEVCSIEHDDGITREPARIITADAATGIVRDDSMTQTEVAPSVWEDTVLRTSVEDTPGLRFQQWTTVYTPGTTIREQEHALDVTLAPGAPPSPQSAQLVSNDYDSTGTTVIRETRANANYNAPSAATPGVPTADPTLSSVATTVTAIDPRLPSATPLAIYNSTFDTAGTLQTIRGSALINYNGDTIDESVNFNIALLTGTTTYRLTMTDPPTGVTVSWVDPTTGVTVSWLDMLFDTATMQFTDTSGGALTNNLNENLNMGSNLNLTIPTVPVDPILNIPLVTGGTVTPTGTLPVGIDPNYVMTAEVYSGLTSGLATSITPEDVPLLTSVTTP